MYRYVTAGNISVHYFRFEHFLLDHFVSFLKSKFQSSQLLLLFLRETCWINTSCFQTQKNNRLNNHDFNIDQNNRDYDFLHNRAALVRNATHDGLLVTHVNNHVIIGFRSWPLTPTRPTLKTSCDLNSMTTSCVSCPNLEQPTTCR